MSARGGRAVAERVAVVVVSLTAAGYLAVAYTAARAEDDLAALKVSTPKPTAADVREARRLAAMAGRATPGERRVLLEAEVILQAGDARRATALLEAAVRREPENAEAWLGLSRAAAGIDPALAERAAQRVRELVPPVPAL
jgi:cytochrome c-type biogenesis protein CcmH/NrfG